MYLKTANLLTGETEATEEEQAKVAEGIKQEIISHWHPNITINIVNDYTNWIPGQVRTKLWRNRVLTQGLSSRQLSKP